MDSILIQEINLKLLQSQENWTLFKIKQTWSNTYHFQYWETFTWNSKETWDIWTLRDGTTRNWYIKESEKNDFIRFLYKDNEKLYKIIKKEMKIKNIISFQFNYYYLQHFI